MAYYLVRLAKAFTGTFDLERRRNMSGTIVSGLVFMLAVASVFPSGFAPKLMTFAVQQSCLVSAPLGGSESAEIDRAKRMNVLKHVIDWLPSV
jgi:hypothetical protein